MSFTWIPTYQVAKSVTPRVLRAPFGDGYTQRASDGLNTQLQEWNLRFVSDSTTINDIESYLLATGGNASFSWTPVGETTAKKFIYTNYSKNSIGKVHILETTFKEEPDLL